MTFRFLLVALLVLAAPPATPQAEREAVLFVCVAGRCSAPEHQVDLLMQYVRMLEAAVIRYREKPKGQCT